MKPQNRSSVYILFHSISNLNCSSAVFSLNLSKTGTSDVNHSERKDRSLQILQICGSSFLSFYRRGQCKHVCVSVCVWWALTLVRLGQQHTHTIVIHHFYRFRIKTDLEGDFCLTISSKIACVLFCDISGFGVGIQSLHRIFNTWSSLSGLKLSCSMHVYLYSSCWLV